MKIFVTRGLKVGFLPKEHFLNNFFEKSKMSTCAHPKYWFSALLDRGSFLAQNQKYRNFEFWVSHDIFILVSNNYGWICEKNGVLVWHTDFFSFFSRKFWQYLAQFGSYLDCNGEKLNIQIFSFSQVFFNFLILLHIWNVKNSILTMWKQFLRTLVRYFYLK